MSIKKKDPTMTMTLRNRVVSQINHRFNVIKKVIRQTVVDNEVLTNAEAAGSGRFVFLRDAEKVDEFMNWLHEQIELEILEKSASGTINTKNHWLNVFIGIAYKRGAEKTRSSIGRKYIDKGLIPETSIFANPAHVERAELIFIRVYGQLKGVTDAMEQQIGRILTDGIIQGKSVKNMALELNDRVDKIGKVRSRLIARTEIVNAHNVAAIKEADNLEGVLGEEVEMIWQTALDGRERDTHRARNKKVYKKDEALSLIGEPNCRCSITPWLKEFGEL